MALKTKGMNSSTRSKSVNPRKIPRTQADVDRSWNDGVIAGVGNATAIFLTVMADKFDFGEQMIPLWNEINKLSEEIKERRVSIGDLKHTLLDEYGIRI